MARDTMASLRADIAALQAALTAAPAAPSEASQHYKDKDLPCTFATKCTKTFRTKGGQAFHKANPSGKHAPKAS